MARNKYLDRKSYRQWLVNLTYTEGPRTQVGVTRVSNECPIAEFLEVQTNREWHVSALACVPQVRAEVEDHEFRTPKWAREYIHNLDRHFGRYPKPITIEDALYVLDEYSR